MFLTFGYAYHRHKFLGYPVSLVLARFHRITFETRISVGYKSFESKTDIETLTSSILKVQSPMS